MSLPKHPAPLTGVSETALMTLNSRATEARRPDRILDDPMAIRLVDSIDFDFTKFGRTGQATALRGLAFDTHTRDYLQQHPSATVVALAEGLETSFWRLNATVVDAEFRWLTIDLPPVIHLRSQLLPSSPRITMRAQSVLDYSWMDQIDPDAGVFITAEGLLMHLEPERALNLIAESARRFPGGQLLFDLPPARAAKSSRRRGLRISRRYRAPALPFGASPSQLATWLTPMTGVSSIHNLRFPRGRSRTLNAVLALNHRLGGRLGTSLTLVEFGRASSTSDG